MALSCRVKGALSLLTYNSRLGDPLADLSSAIIFFCEALRPRGLTSFFGSLMGGGSTRVGGSGQSGSFVVEGGVNRRGSGSNILTKCGALRMNK